VAPAPRYVRRTDQATGIEFVFKTDPDAPEMLHIYARHLTTVEDAMAAFREGEELWDATHRRFETYTTTHGLYWFWLEPGGRVMVVSCFRIERGDDS
jgi:L-amino acid N-acyltransferase YncA